MSLYKIQFQTKQKNTTNTIAHTEIKKKNKKHQRTHNDPIVDIGYDILHVRYDKSPETK